jgi:Kef-type K+ transport system membrane component KefB
MVGLSLDLSAVDWGSGFIWLFSLTLLGVAIAGKLIGGLVVSENPFARVAIGMAMVPRGEVGLIFAELGRTAGVFDAGVYAAIVLVIAYTTLLTPFWLKQYYKRFGHRWPDTPAPR